MAFRLRRRRVDSGHNASCDDAKGGVCNCAECRGNTHGGQVRVSGVGRVQPGTVSRRDPPDRLAAPGEGGTRSYYAYYYGLAPSYGIFDEKGKKEFAERNTRTAVAESGEYRRNVRAWVAASKSALASGDRYRIAETARETPPAPAELAGVPEVQGIREHMGQAAIAGRHMEQAENDKDFDEHRREFQSIVSTVDAQTRGWESA